MAHTSAIKPKIRRCLFSGRCAVAAAIFAVVALPAPLYAGDYTKIANNGTALAADARLGSGPNDWACTRDNANGLVWEIKTADGGLHDKKHTYAWFNTDPSVSGGNAGFYGSDTCGGTLPAYKNQCNTANYVAAINAAALCGYTDWRLPHPEELRLLVDYGRENGPSPIDPAYFPNPAGPFYWTVSAAVGLYLETWYVNVGETKGGGCASTPKQGNYSVQLVRGGRIPVLSESGSRKPQDGPAE